MKQFKRWILVVLVLAIAISACGCVFGENKKIAKADALQIALEDAGLTSDEAMDIDIELEKSFSKVWYEVGFESGRVEYEYKIDAHSGEIISATTD